MVTLRWEAQTQTELCVNTQSVFGEWWTEHICLQLMNMNIVNCHQRVSDAYALRQDIKAS